MLDFIDMMRVCGTGFFFLHLFFCDNVTPLGIFLSMPFLL